jgi:hypothetical protein
MFLEHERNERKMRFFVSRDLRTGKIYETFESYEQMAQTIFIYDLCPKGDIDNMFITH